MINRIAVKNFKSLKDVSVEMSYLNLFTGINGMGKSTLIQTLLLLRQSTLNKVFLNGDFIEIGSVSDALCDSRNNEIITFELEQSYSNLLNENRKWELGYDSKSDNYLKINSIKLESNRTDMNDFLDYSQFQYLSAERIGPRKYNNTNSDAVNNSNLGVQGEYALHYLFENQNHNIGIKSIAKEIINPNQDIEDTQIDYSLKTQLEAWLGEISPNIVTKPEWYKELNVIGSFFAYKQNNQSDTSSFKAVNVGFGISYILPVVLSILIAKKDDIVIIENPEAHLHPKGQVILAELMSIAAQNGVQLFIETHSDHIFDGIRIATKEKKIEPEKSNILFFDRDTTEHTTNIQRIKIDKDGLIDHMPINFFDQFDVNLSKLI